MAFKYDGYRIYDGDTDCVAFRVSEHNQTETWRVSHEALQDHFGADDPLAAFDSGASSIVDKGNQARRRNPAYVVIKTADF